MTLITSGMNKDPAASRLYLAIDQGGHSSRAIVFDHTGCAITSASAAINTLNPQTDWIEHDPEELIGSIQSTLDQVIDQLGDQRTDLHSAGLATQRSSIVCWDKNTGEALSPVISWQDRRNAELINQLALHAEKVQSLTGLRLSPHYGASKLRWCLDHLPEVNKALKEQRLACGPLASFIIFRVLEENPLLVDPANASRTLLWDLHHHDWSSELLDLFGIPKEILPCCTFSQSDFGYLRSGKINIPLSVMTGDQSAAIYAYGQPEADTVFINMGTGAFLQRVIGSQPLATYTLLCSTVWQDKKTTNYVMEGTVNGAGSAISRIIKELGLDHDNVLNQIANWLATSTTPPLFLNGVGGLGSPWWEADFQSRFIGYGSGSGSAEEKIVAVLESIAFLINKNLQEMQDNKKGIAQIILTGGLSNLDGLCQRLADLSGLKISRPDYTEATARGLAFLLARKKSKTWEKIEINEFTPETNQRLIERYDKWCSEMICNC